MAFLEAERARIRHYLGFGALYFQADPRLEDAMTAVQSVADGGTRPDNTSEAMVRGWLGQLTVLERRMTELWDEIEALKVDELGVDPVRGLAMLKSEGRRLVAGIARAFETRPRFDVFSSAVPRNDD